MSDLLDDHSMVVSHVNRNYAHHDRKTDGNLDASLCHRKSDLLGDRKTDVNLGVRNHHVK
jgi:hypothetical protein